MGGQSMDIMVEWLASVETLARDLYADAAARFGDDETFRAFLIKLSDDEEYHRTVMERASRVLGNGGAGIRAEIALDEEVKYRVREPLDEARRMLQEGAITRDGMMERIIAAEYSEWNTIFLYVVDSIRDGGREFQYAASRLERHKLEIARLCDMQVSCAAGLAKITTLPSLWKHHILVVDDNAAMLRFLSALLSRTGVVDTAPDGKAALGMTRDNYYDLIVSDIDMPVMDGISFFTEAEKLDAGIARRFLFFTGAPGDAHGEFIRARALRCLEKPASISSIYEAVREILE